MSAAAKVQKTQAKGRIGSRFDDFLREQGTYAQTQAVAIKRVLAWQLAEEMKKQKLTKSAMAKRMETSRSQLDRLLDPENAEVQLETLTRAARAVNCELHFQLTGANARAAARR
jgi:antitoxin HicB